MFPSPVLPTCRARRAVAPARSRAWWRSVGALVATAALVAAVRRCGLGDAARARRDDRWRRAADQRWLS